MKKIKYHLSFLLLFLFVIVSSLPAQTRDDRQGIVRDQLMNLIHVKYGPIFQYVGYTIFDSLIYYSSIDNENIKDPYKTLSGCILFSAYGDGMPNTYIVGVVKNGEIIWDNAPGTKADLGGDLLFAQDINKDGEVDLVFSEVDQDILSIGGGPNLYYYYVLSWNGTSGRFISAFDSNGISAMMGDGSCDLVDKNGDGIKEIKTALPDIDMDFGDLQTSTFPYVTYGWNGSQYGFWSSIDQIAGDEFLPANNLIATVRCFVGKMNNAFNYDYTVSSDSSSMQIISDIYIGGLEDTTSNLAPGLWQSGSSSYIGGRAFIKFFHGTYYLIHPGQTLGGFQTISSVLPTIVKYYIQGYTPPIFVSDAAEQQNILNNSVQGYTLGTSDTTRLFDDLSFLDTLKSFTTQSRTLGWIMNALSANTYSLLFDSAKAQLQRNDNRSARTTLDTVMQHAIWDSSSVLSSEAFALIYFNTQYLLAQLPTLPPQYMLTINESGNGSVTLNPNLTLVDSGTTLQLTATPSSGYSFSSWTGDASGSSNPLSVVMNGNKTITATFIQNTFTITATAGLNGSISPNGTVNVNYGVNQIFTITSNTSYHIDSVFIDNNYVGNSSLDTVKNVTASHTISVTFAINQYTITSSAGSNGTISPLGNVGVNYGGTQAFTITPSTGYHVDSLIVDGINQGQLTSYTVTNVTANHTITAKFAIIHDTITAGNGSNGTINPSGAVIVNYGANQTFTFTPNTGYYVDSLIVDGVKQTSASSYTFTNVTANHTIRVTFSNQYTLTILISGGGGTVTKSPNYSTYSYGTTVTLTAHKQINGIDPQIKINPLVPVPKEWDFDHWELDASGTTNPITITMNGNKTVRAVFVAVY